MTNDKKDNISPDMMPGLRFPAEWEDHQCVMLAWPHEDTDWAYMLDEARRCFADIVSSISRHECVLLVGPWRLCRESVEKCAFDPRRVRFVDIPTNDTWARDFGALTVSRPTGPVALDFKFNGWGLKFAADKDNLITRGLADKGILMAPVENHLDFVLEGGSVESDGEGTLLTTSECLLSPNRNGALSRMDIEDYLQRAFGVKRMLWLDHGALAGDDTDSHIDTLARFAPHDTIVYTGPGEDGDPNNDSLIRMREQLHTFVTGDGKPYNLIELPLPDPLYDDNGMQLPATYANYLVTPGFVYIPVYGQPRKDMLAAQMLRIVYPDHEIMPIDCKALIQQHGSLHCVTMQFPEGIISGIEDGEWK